MWGFILGIAIVVAVGAIYLVAVSSGLPVGDGIAWLGAWMVLMVVMSLPSGVLAREEILAKISDTPKQVALVIAFVAFAAAIIVAWRRYREQLHALTEKLPEPPKTSFKRVVARGTDTHQ